MALRFIDSMAHYATADLVGKWTAILNCSIQTTGGRWGGRCLRVDTTGGYARVAIDNQQRWYLAIATKMEGNGDSDIIRILDGTTKQVELRRTVNNALVVTRNGTTILGPTAASLFSSGTWIHLQLGVKIDNTAGEIEVKLNGVTVLSGTGLDTQNTANAYGNAIELAGQVSGSYHYFNDAWFADAQGTVNNALPGDVRVWCLVPTGAGNYAQWTPSAGANWQCVDEIPPNGDTDYVSSATAGQKDSYAFQDISGTGAVKGVQISLWARKDDGGTRQVRTLARIASTDYTGDTRSLADSYRCERQIHDVSPATAAPWTLSEINGAEFGAELVS